MPDVSNYRKLLAYVVFIAMRWANQLFGTGTDEVVALEQADVVAEVLLEIAGGVAIWWFRNKPANAP